MRLSLIRYGFIAGLILGCVLLNGCATRPAQTTQAARIGLELAPATLGQSLSLQQHLTIERAGHIAQMDTALEIDPDHLHLVGLLLGQRVMTLSYDGKHLQVWRNPRLPKQVRGEDVLEDIELTLWPVAEIRKALPAGWRVEDKGKRRLLWLDNKLIVVINYSGNQRWQGTIVLNNLRYHYRLTIQSVGTATPS